MGRGQRARGDYTGVVFKEAAENLDTSYLNQIKKISVEDPYKDATANIKLMIQMETFLAESKVKKVEKNLS